MFRNIIRSLKTRILWEECYKRQEEKGISIFGMCCGELNSVEDKIADECQDCAYYVGKTNGRIAPETCAIMKEKFKGGI